jgi:hypothetical protein
MSPATRFAVGAPRAQRRSAGPRRAYQPRYGRPSYAGNGQARARYGPARPGGRRAVYGRRGGYGGGWGYPGYSGDPGGWADQGAYGDPGVGYQGGWGIPGISPGGHVRTGRWIRRGRKIILLGV